MTEAIALDNPAWSALTTHQAHLAGGGDLVKRYPTDVAQIAAVGRCHASTAAAIDPLVPEGEWLSFPATVEHLAPLVPHSLRVTMEQRLVQMIGPRHLELPRLAVNVVRLTEIDAQDMVALAVITQPGPFRDRTYTLGTYLGIRIGGQLVAMAGQRMHLPGYREISAVCTHPDHQGRGYARLLVAHLVNAIREEGLTSFLHLQEANTRAHALYAGMGFVERARLPLIVVERA